MESNELPSSKIFHKVKLNQNEINTLIEKIKSYLLEQKEIIIDNYIKDKILSSKDKSKHSTHITDIDIITHIFTKSSSNACQLMECLNSIRFQLIIMQIPQFELIVNIFMGLLDRYAKKHKFKEIHLTALDYIIILSQTFYCEKSNTDTIMANYIGQHCIWKEKLWSTLINRFIEKEKKTQKKTGLEFNEIALVTSTLITYKFIIKSFHQNDLSAINKIGSKYNVEIPEV
jgi:hypothetical protein